MADLTERLGLTSGTNRVIADPAAPSGIGAALDFATQAINGYSKLKGDMAASKAAKKAAEQKQREAEIAFQVTGLPNAAARDVAASRQSSMTPGFSETEAMSAMSPLTPSVSGPDPLAPLAAETDVFSGTPLSITPSMEKMVNREIGAIKNVITAVDQGRMPPISMQAAVASRFAALREQFPNDTEYLLDMVKKAGIDPALYTEMKDAVDEHDFVRKQEQAQRSESQKREESAIEAATKTLGPDSIGMSREDLIVHGLNVMRQGTELDLISRQTAIRLQQASLTAEGAKAIKEDTNEKIFSNINNAIYNQAVPVIRTIENLAASLMKDPKSSQNLEAWQQQGVRVRQLIPQIAENALQTAIANGYTGDADAFKKRITDVYGPLTDLFTGDHSVVNASVTALRGIETAAKISTAEALPFMTALTKAGIKVTEMPGFLKAIDGNPDLQKRLSEEIKGYVTDWGTDKASTHLLTAIKVMRGETTLAYMDPTTARTMVPTLVRANRAMAADYVAGKEVDGDKVLNTTGEIVVATRSIGPSAGANTLYVATQGFANPTTRSALIRTLNDSNVDNKDIAVATIQASRAASAHTLNNIRLSAAKANQASPYFKVQWDERNGQYAINRSGLNAAIQKAKAAGVRDTGVMGISATAGSRSGPNLQTLMSMEPPEVIRRLVDAGNMNLDNAIQLGKHDPSTPQATENQLRNWYGQEKPLPAGPAEKQVDPTKEVGKQLDILDDVLDEGFQKSLKAVEQPRGERRAPNLSGKEVVIPDLDTIATKFAGNSNYQQINREAQRLGVPTEVATRLGYVESGGSFADNMNANRAGAMGPIQVVPKYHNGLAQQLFGKNVPDLTPSEIITVGLTYLKSEYEKHGNWADAVSAYHSGGPLAKRSKSHDGNIYTRDYVRLIAG